MNNKEKRRYWQKHIESQQASGLTQVAYCTQHHLKPGAFGYWKAQFAPKARSNRLLPLMIQQGSMVSIYAPGGIRIEASLDAAVQLLPSILARAEAIQ